MVTSFVNTVLHRYTSYVAPIVIALAPALLRATGLTDPLGNITLYNFLFTILNAVIYILFPVIVLMLVYTGFLFVAAQGNPAKIQEARRALVWTIIGALVLLGAKAIALAVQATVDDLTT